MIRCLDTNILVDFLRGRDLKLKERLLAASPRDYEVSEVVRAELLFGARISSRPRENKQSVENLLFSFKLLPFGGSAVDHYVDIRAHLTLAGTTIGSNDLIIAATARAAGRPLVTRNDREFSRVPDLRLEIW